MFFYRSRDPYYGYSPAAGCFGSLLATLVIAAILIVCAIYIGSYALIKDIRSTAFFIYSFR